VRTLLAILAIISLSFAGCVEEPARSEPEPTPAEPDTGNMTLEPLSFAATVKLVRGNLTIDTPVVFAAGSDLRADAAANATWTAQLIQMNATTNVTQSAGNATGMGVSGEGNLTPSLAGNLTLRLTVVAEGDDDTTAFLNISIGQNMTEAFTIPEPLVFTGTFSGPSASGIPGDSATLEFSVDGPVSKVVFSMEYTELAGAPEADNDLDWSWAGPGTTGAAANYGKESDVSISSPGQGSWTIMLDFYSVPSDLDYTVPVTFS
jgi:hypothetical protein